jgi:LiaI-LiaF-like transmembrane region
VTIGIIFIVAGVVLLLDSIGVLHDVGVGQLWPVAVIAIGISIVYNQVRRSWRRR